MAYESLPYEIFWCKIRTAVPKARSTIINGLIMILVNKKEIMIINSLNMGDEEGDRHSISFRALEEITTSIGKLVDDTGISSGKSHFVNCWVILFVPQLRSSKCKTIFEIICAICCRSRVFLDDWSQ